mmetsp:Transcript_26804/g.80798  ORF Transcript_26804/g.80798 Transcript_26804/m.80798 type:complete len:210 (-) Transcript_26804:621-1250(-)
MAKNAPTVRWYSSPMVLPEVVPASTPASWSKYKFNSGNACKSVLNIFRVYPGSAMLLAIFLTTAQSVCRPRIAACSAGLGWSLGSSLSSRVWMLAMAVAALAGSGTRLMVWTFATVAGGRELPVDRREMRSERRDRMRRSASLLAHVQMFSCVPMGRPSASSCPLKLNSPSVVANSCPCGRPMHCTARCSGLTTRKVTSCMQYRVFRPG